MIVYKIVNFFCFLAFKIAFKYKVYGRENIPKDKNFIVVSNHTSNFDPPLLGVSSKLQLAYMAKEELFRNRFAGWFLRILGAFPVSRKGGDIGAIKTAFGLLKDGKNLVMFPEGSKSKTKGMLKKGKSGATMIAIKAMVGILPVGISADFKFRGKVCVTIGEYIDLSEYYGTKLSAEELQKITDDVVMTNIAKLAGVKVYECENR